jgi:adenosylhomocysteinase
MVEAGLTVFARHGADDREYGECHRLALEAGIPDLFVDDGGDITALLHSRYSRYLPDIMGGCEETTTGLQGCGLWTKAASLKCL